MSERDNLGLPHRCHYWSTKEKVNHDINLDEARWGNWKDQAGHQNHQQRRKGPQAQTGSTHRIRVLQPSMSEPEGPGGGSGSLTDQHLDDHRAYPPICKIRTSPACSPCLRGEYNSERMDVKSSGKDKLTQMESLSLFSIPSTVHRSPFRAYLPEAPASHGSSLLIFVATRKGPVSGSMQWNSRMPVTQLWVEERALKSETLKTRIAVKW